MRKIFTSPTTAICGFLIFSFLFFLYSFTQIDLSLVFSHNPLLLSIEKSFQQIGYFNRPLSVELFLFIILGMYVLYVGLLSRIRNKKIASRTVWGIIALSMLLFMLAYNAFSYDIFNYIFDAKIVTFYQENPYVKKALDFPTDPMLSFMRWTHRVYPYGPIWLGLTVPLSFLGFQSFPITYFLFKLLMALSFLGSDFFLYKIIKNFKSEFALFGTAFFALNPLVLTESLISAHNDIVMMFFALGSLYFLQRKKIMLAIIFLLLSIGIKFATIFLVPVFIYILILQYQKKPIHWERMFFLMLLSLLCAVLAVTLRTNFQPWYLLYILPIAAILSYRKSVSFSVILFSLVSLFNYAPFLYLGNWDPPIPEILRNINIAAFIGAFGIFYLYFRKEEKVSA